MMPVSDLERRFINGYQGGVPLIEQPYRSMAADLGCSEDTLLDSIRHLLDTGALSRFGPLYDAVKTGGGLTLAAMSVPVEHYDRVTEQVNAFAEVAHNYRRDHALNMWFVLATESLEAIDTTLAAIQHKTGIAVYNFPKQHEFYIGLWLHLQVDGRVSTVPVPAGRYPALITYEMDATDREIIRFTQAGLPLVPSPWLEIAAQLGCSSLDVKCRMQYMQAAGIIRRIGAVPNHYRLGLTGNGMTVWDVPEHRARQLGETIGELEYVSHCYLRPRHMPVWRYNLFAMVHGQDHDEVRDKAEHIRDLLGDDCIAGETLFSTAILKKTGMRAA
jgi:DNA-binding Lrp family transcriptional regulator